MSNPHSVKARIAKAVASAVMLALIVLPASCSGSYWAVAFSGTERQAAEALLPAVASAVSSNSSVIEARVGGKTYFRAAAGPFPTREAAISARDTLRSAGWPDSWLLFLEQEAHDISEASDAVSAGRQDAVEDAQPMTDAARARSITVGLTWVRGERALFGTDGDIIARPTGEAVDASLVCASEVLELFCKDGLVFARTDEADPGVALGRKVALTASAGVVWISEPYKAYKGELSIAASADGTLAVANVLDVDDYLLSVLPSEIGTGAPKQAYKAQAVVARTEALAYSGRHASSGWDICDSTHCQVFKGLYGQSPNADIQAAVSETEGEALFWGGSMVRTASFHSACGGWTESSQDIWGSSYAHLTNIGCRINSGVMPDLKDEQTLRKYVNGEDKQDLCYGTTGYRWKASVDAKSLEAQLLKMAAEGLATASGKAPSGGLPRITKRSNRGAALEISVCAGSVEYIMKGELNIRRLFGGATVAKSGVFVIDAGKNGGLTLTGAGYGHGVGLCQEGAQKLAKLGLDYAKILAFYYKGSSIGKVY